MLCWCWLNLAQFLHEEASSNVWYSTFGTNHSTCEHNWCCVTAVSFFKCAFAHIFILWYFLGFIIWKWKHKSCIYLQSICILFHAHQVIYTNLYCVQNVWTNVLEAVYLYCKHSWLHTDRLAHKQKETAKIHHSFSGVLSLQKLMSSYELKYWTRKTKHTGVRPVFVSLTSWTIPAFFPHAISSTSLFLRKEWMEIQRNNRDKIKGIVYFD